MKKNFALERNPLIFAPAFETSFAGMAELVDAYVSGAYASNGVRVRLSLPAQTKGLPIGAALFVLFILVLVLTPVKQNLVAVIGSDKQVVIFDVIFSKRLYFCFAVLLSLQVQFSVLCEPVNAIHYAGCRAAR